RAWHRARAAGKDRREPAGDDPGRGGRPRLRGRRSRVGLASDSRSVARGDRGRNPHRRPRRPRGHVRVHGRGDPADEVEARGLVDALAARASSTPHAMTRAPRARLTAPTRWASGSWPASFTYVSPDPFSPV